MKAIYVMAVIGLLAGIVAAVGANQILNSAAGIEINAAGNIDMMSNDDDDYVSFSTAANVPRLLVSGDAEFQILQSSDANAKVRYQIDNGGNGDTNVYLRNDANTQLVISSNNEGYQGLHAEESMRLASNDDASDYLLFSTTNDEVNISGVGFENIYFLDGANWNTLHADAFTEHSNPYTGTVEQAKADIQDFVDVKHPERLSTQVTIIDDEDCVQTDAGRVCTPTAVHTEYVGADLGKAAKANSKVLLDLIARVEALEAAK